MRGGWFGIVGLLAVGCGGAGKPVPVHGVVLLDNQPLAGATVTFVPDSPTARGAHAYSFTGGVFKMSTHKPDDGVVPGDYKVLVTYTEPTPEMPAGATQEEVIQYQEKAAKARKKPLLILPEKYTSPDKTPLRQKVPPPAGSVKLELSTKG